jgi:hypothetical protein
VIVPPLLQKPIGSNVPPELVLPLDDDEELLLLLDELEELEEELLDEEELDDEDELEEDEEDDELLLEEELEDEPPLTGKSTTADCASWPEAEAVQLAVVAPTAASDLVEPAPPEPDDERS